MLLCIHFQLFWLFVSPMLFALLILLTTYPTTNLFLSLSISAFTNGFWLYFDGYIKCLDSWSTLNSKLVLWFLVTLSMHTSKAWNFGAPIFDILILYDVTKFTYWFLLCHFSVESGHLSSLASLLIVARARPTFYKDDMMSRSFHISFCFVIFCRIRSPQLTGNPFDSSCCSCTTYILQKWQPSWFEASVEWPSSDVFAFLLWISPC